MFPLPLEQTDPIEPNPTQSSPPQQLASLSPLRQETVNERVKVGEDRFTMKDSGQESGTAQNAHTKGQQGFSGPTPSAERILFAHFRRQTVRHK